MANDADLPVSGNDASAIPEDDNAPTEGPPPDRPAEDGAGRTVISQLRDVLGFDPSIQLREIASESDVFIDAENSDEKYVVEREIGEGGMGRVFLALDRDLRRQVAIKVLKKHLAGDRDYLARFIEEAQITGQLEHPGIPPVHELAINHEREIFFTLKLLRGRTLKEILRDLHIGRRDIRRRYSRTRLLQHFLSVCNAVHFAHEKGVIHRDIKPENIMVGDFGEVQLMDWGIAKVVSQERRDDAVEDPVETVRTDQHMVTSHGQVSGTLLYISPEQAQGRSSFVDRRSDVYSLGATLYEVLTLLPPKTGTSMADLLEESRLGLVIPPSVRAPKQEIPPELEEICMKALEYHPDDRYSTALELAEAIQVYLDGSLEEERRRVESEHLLREAHKVLQSYDREKGLLQKLARESAELVASAGNFPALETKERILQLKSEMESKDISVAQKYTQAQTLLSAALSAEPENGAARRALGELYLERFLRAERDGNATDMIFYEGLIAQVNDGTFDRILQGNGSLSVTSSPGNATFVLFRYEEHEGRLEPQAEIARGVDRLEIADIPMGSYLLIIEKDGFVTTRYPVMVGRNQKIQDIVKLYPEIAIPSGFVYVPRGAFIMYGDPNVASTAKNRARRDIAGFAVGQYPVTCGEYVEFLNDLHAEDPQLAQARCPRESENAGYLWEVENGAYRLPKSGRYPWSDSLPVMGVSFDDALAYCRHRSERDGRTYELPNEADWEKAAKGVDGRYFSWGNAFDNEFANNLYCRESGEGVVQVEAYPEDCSPYGVRGMVGNVSDWCYLDGDERPGMVAVRGGNWALTEYGCRLAVRRSTHDKYVSDRFGFRLKLSLE